VIKDTGLGFDMVSLILHKVVCLDLSGFKSDFKIMALATMSHSMMLRCNCQAFSSSAWLALMKASVSTVHFTIIQTFWFSVQ